MASRGDAAELLLFSLRPSGPSVVSSSPAVFIIDQSSFSTASSSLLVFDRSGLDLLALGNSLIRRLESRSTWETLLLLAAGGLVAYFCCQKRDKERRQEPSSSRAWIQSLIAQHSPFNRSQRGKRRSQLRDITPASDQSNNLVPTDFDQDLYCHFSDSSDDDWGSPMDSNSDLAAWVRNAREVRRMVRDASSSIDSFRATHNPILSHGNDSDLDIKEYGDEQDVFVESERMSARSRHLRALRRSAKRYLQLTTHHPAWSNSSSSCQSRSEDSLIDAKNSIFKSVYLDSPNHSRPTALAMEGLEWESPEHGWHDVHDPRYKMALLGDDNNSAFEWDNEHHPYYIDHEDTGNLALPSSMVELDLEQELSRRSRSSSLTSSIVSSSSFAQESGWEDRQSSSASSSFFLHRQPPSGTSSDSDTPMRHEEYWSRNNSSLHYYQSREVEVLYKCAMPSPLSPVREELSPKKRPKDILIQDQMLTIETFRHSEDDLNNNNRSDSAPDSEVTTSTRLTGTKTETKSMLTSTPRPPLNPQTSFLRPSKTRRPLRHRSLS